MSLPTVAIVGPGNIGTDLMLKLRASSTVDVRWMIGIDPASDGLRLAREQGLETSAEGVEWLLARPELPDLVIEATSAYVHARNAPRYEAAGIKVIDLTPAALGPYVVPTVNIGDHLTSQNLNMVTCGGQATIPIVAAVRKLTPVPYAEIIASIASRSAGPGTRANIDEFTRTTARAIESVGGATQGKAIIVLNPAEPPITMRDTVYCMIAADADQAAITDSIVKMVESVATFVPGYRLAASPQFDPPNPAWGGHGRVAILLEIEGAGDYLPPYAGNLDIMTAAATRVAEQLLSTRPEGL